MHFKEVHSNKKIYMFVNKCDFKHPTIEILYINIQKKSLFQKGFFNINKFHKFRLIFFFINMF